MHHTRNVSRIGEGLVELMTVFATPQSDQALLREAGVKLDRALFPLLIRLSGGKETAMAALAGEVGRDPTTVSRQIATLEGSGLVSRPAGGGDRRVRSARLTAAGEAAVKSIVAARERLLSQALNGWKDEELDLLGSLNLRLAASLQQAAARRRFTG